MRKDELDKLMSLLTKDAIYIPKKIMYFEVYEETKIMFSVILTENSEFINSCERFPLKEMIEIYKNIDVSRIEYECFCGEPKAKIIKDEMIEIAEQLEDLLDIPEERRSLKQEV